MKELGEVGRNKAKRENLSENHEGKDKEHKKESQKKMKGRVQQDIRIGEAKKPGPWGWQQKGEKEREGRTWEQEKQEWKEINRE